MKSPVYLYTGPEIGERDEQVESIKAAQRKLFGDCDEYLLYASDTGIEEVIVKLQTESLFVPATTIILREAELIKKKDEIALVEAWLKTEAAKPEDLRGSSVLILVSDEISVDSKLSKIIPKENQKIFWEISGERLSFWLSDYMRKNGYSIDQDALELILELTDGNTQALKNECSRFFLCFQKGHHITSEDVEQLIAHNREESAFTLFNALCDTSVPLTARFQNSLLILEKLLLSKSSNSVVLMAGLASCFRKLQLWHSIHIGQQEPNLKANGFTSKKAVAQYTRASRIWSFGQTAAILALIAQTDMDIRSGGTALQKTQLSLLIYEIVMKGGVKISSWELPDSYL